MALLLYLGTNRECHIPLRRDMIPYFPWYAMVNRVIPLELDPFITESPSEFVHELKVDIKEHKFEDLMNQRALELLSLDKTIYMMWSGGIDSTATLVALLSNATPQQIDNMYILCSSESIKEYPAMYQRLQSIFHERILSSHVHPVEYCRKGIIITGEFGDQLMGSDVMYNIEWHLGNEYLFKPWQETMPLLYEKMWGPNNFVERYEPTISHSLYPIKSAYDWNWWINFTNKWNHIKYRILGWDGWGNEPHLYWNMKHFYDTVQFQQWSMTHPDLKIKDTLESYKFLQKEYIAAYTKDENYLGNKKKVASMQNIWRRKRIHYGITPQLEYLTDEQIREYVNNGTTAVCR